ncbi:hypothetical protein K435DRAFT_675928 [Dendrothele bispora CBS 962.96]|uniref:SWIM-type domain-containing protein n=1 Tax=Dendrothele bispora (strain CBS 962.96) TaxID=1314807 RepID=A0A4S8LN49_DENBC|nr:hypothetical protein K435DRAFT_675928 [Dendrothele bispora CBS 962.96]
MQEDFANDDRRISTHWLLRLITQQKLQVEHLLRVHRIGTETSGLHYLEVLADGRVICDCCMQLNLGIPCRHYFQVFTRFQGLAFSIGMIRPRWLQPNSSRDINAIPPVTFNHVVGRSGHLSAYSRLPPLLQTNPVDSSSGVSHPTETLNARTIFHEVNATLRPLIEDVRTSEQLEALLQQIKDLPYV